MSIDLNADVGEGLSTADRAILPLITSANIACGGHAGDAETMRTTLESCNELGVAAGAHPGYPDREGFGRREFAIEADELRASIHVQIEALLAVSRSVGVRVVHVKPHGTLYNKVATDRATADLLAGVVAGIDRSFALVGMPGSESMAAGRAAGLRVIAEGFADRAYEADGSLRSRQHTDAVHDDPRRVAMQAVSMARDGRVALGDGRWLPVQVDSICLHGDAPDAVANVMSVRAALAASGIDVAQPAMLR